MRKLLTLLLLLALFLTAFPQTVAASGQAPSGLPLSELESRIDALVAEHLGTSIPGAAIVVVHEGEIIFSRGYSYANIERGIQVDPASTVFEYASISKLFTWVAVMQLVEQGLLDINTDIHTYLPASLVFEMPFTMRDLMNHMAGFADVFFGYSFDGVNLPTLEEVLLATQPVQIFTPGTVSAYSNWGTALAGMVVAEIAGQDFAAYERENILLPTNMQHTLNLPDWFGNDNFLANHAQGYFVRDGVFLESMSAYTLDYPSGALRGTAEDLALFIKALTPPAGESGSLFEHAETLQTLFSSSSLDPINQPTTHHGFFTYSGVLPSFGHGGNLPGFSTDLVIVPEQRFGFAVLTNTSLEMNLIPLLGELLLGTPQTPQISSSLPCTHAVEGRFISARRFGGGNITEIVNFMTPLMQISALDENTIQLSYWAVGAATYIQVEPFVFHIYDSSGSPLLGQRLPELRFRMEDGVPVQIIAASGGDFTSLPAGRTMPFLIISLISASISIVFFLVMPIILFILFIVRRKKQIERTQFDRFSVGFLLSGSLLVLNNLVFLLFGMPVHVWINYMLAVIVILLFAGSLWSWHTGKIRIKQRVLFAITTVFTILFSFILHSWGFFVFI